MNINNRKDHNYLTDYRFLLVEKFVKQVDAHMQAIAYNTLDTHRMIDVIYEQPSFEDLCKIFNNVSDYFRLNTRFKPVGICERVVQKPKQLDFKPMYFGAVSSYTALSLLAQRNFRPAMYEEAICFARHVEFTVKERRLVILGSSVKFDGNPRAAILRMNGEDKTLYANYYKNDEWDSDHHFLAVPLDV